MIDLKALCEAAGFIKPRTYIASGNVVFQSNETEAQVKAQWAQHARPMYEQFVAPQERWADVVLETPPDEREVMKMATAIRSYLFSGSERL